MEQSELRVLPSGWLLIVVPENDDIIILGNAEASEREMKRIMNALYEI